jgi:thiol:disulfide interchange protein DsbC
MFAAYPYRSYLATLVLCLAASFACAAQDGIPSAVVQTLSKMVPGTQPDSIVAAPVPGLYEVMFGPHVVYVTGDGKHMFRGDLIDAKSRINLTAGKRDEARAGAVEKLGEDSMIVFSPKDPS